MDDAEIRTRLVDSWPILLELRAAAIPEEQVEHEPEGAELIEQWAEVADVSRSHVQTVGIAMLRRGELSDPAQA